MENLTPKKNINMKTSEIRRRFLNFWAERGHQVLPSSPLIPRDDPTLLFTNAGMVQFKKIFQGKETPAYLRASTAQKCLRVGGKHNDLENVGRTARHHTFFEMLGNFSFGDYFKKEAIAWAYEFLAVELGLPEEKLYITVHVSDDEAEKIWLEDIKIPKERIFRLGDKDNFWTMADVGPCGPCSEILIDQGADMACGPYCGIGKCECDRFLELWNLVFMQYDQKASGERDILPRPSIDTGMGLERVAAVCQGVYSNYDTDLFAGLIEKAADLAGKTYGQDEETDTALRVIADHARSAAFLTAEGVLPSNEGRGYILRRLIRRAFRFGKLAGLNEPFLWRIAEAVADEMGEAFPELIQEKDFLKRVIRDEEAKFADTLDKGLEILAEELSLLEKTLEKIIPGQVAFKLYDTYGFPLDIVRDVAEKSGFQVDEAGYEEAMANQREKAKKAWKGIGDEDPADFFARFLDKSSNSKFAGYDSFKCLSRITVLAGADGAPQAALGEGETGFLVTEATPFYGESGGQVGDTGVISCRTGKAVVLDALKPWPEVIVHRIKVEEGQLALNDEVELTVDDPTRLATARNHTATHLLHSALREILGGHVKQAGSLAAPERLRFDFTHLSAMTAEELNKVERLVNSAIMADLPVQTALMDKEAAAEKGAIALFGEKYGDQVRVVEVPGCSIELCGGTHLEATGQIGLFSILSESGIAAGVRRIEALTGFGALEHLEILRKELEESREIAKAAAGELPGKIRNIQAQVKSLKKECETLKSKAASGQGKDFLEGIEEVAGVKLLCIRLEGTDPKSLRDMLDDLRSRLPSGIIALASVVEEGKAALAVGVTKDLQSRFPAGALVKAMAASVGGSGGGRPDMAQAGGSNPAGIEAAFDVLKRTISGN